MRITSIFLEWSSILDHDVVQLPTHVDVIEVRALATHLRVIHRASTQPIIEAVPRSARRRRALRWHPYFTRPFERRTAYIERYSIEGDLVLDPFGGTA